jgi:predicted lipid-binding transport protein (Tim44 family)
MERRAFVLKLESHRFPENGEVAIVARFDQHQMITGEAMAATVLREIASQVAERYVAENYQDIVKLISPEAIATLSAAEAAAAIRETLEKKIPDKVLEVVRTEREVYQRGILGGIKRVL